MNVELQQLRDSFTHIIDQITLQQKPSSDLNLKDLLQNGVYSSSQSKSLPELLKIIENWWYSSKENQVLPQQSTRFHLLALSSLLQSYLQQSLTILDLQKWSQMLHDSVVQMVKQLFQIPDKFSGFHFSGDNSGTSLIGLSSLSRRFPLFETEGFSALSKWPVVIASQSMHDQAKQICSTLGLPQQHCVRLLPSHNSDLKVTLEQLLNQITGEGGHPFLVLIQTVPPFFEDFSSLKKLCGQHQCWIHVEGNFPLLLASGNAPNESKSILECDSFTFTPLEWSKNLVVFGNMTFISKMSSPVNCSPFTQLSSLPLWIILQFYGTECIKKLITQNLESVQQFRKQLKDIPNVVNCEFHSPCAFFRYESPSLNVETDSLIHRVNEQIFVDLIQAVPGVALTLELENINNSTYLLYNPFKDIFVNSAQLVIPLTEAFQTITSLIETTLKFRQFFVITIETFPGFQNAQVANFIGLGAVRYVPPWLGFQELSQDIQNEINILNQSVATELMKEDALFWKTGLNNEGNLCLCLGVDTSPLNEETIKQYAEKIAQITGEMEKTYQIVEKIGEILRKGIVSAQEQIMQEEEDVFWNQEGVMRQLPLVGSVVNWWSPLEKAQTKGRTFNIASTSLQKSTSPKTTNE